MADSAAGIICLVYGTALEALGSAALAEGSMDKHGIASVCAGGVLCSVAALDNTVSPITFATVGGSGIPTAIALSAIITHTKTPTPSRAFIAAVALTVAGTVWVVVKAKSAEFTPHNTPTQHQIILFWAALVATVAAGIANASLAKTPARPVAIVSAAAAGCLTVAVLWSAGSSLSYAETAAALIPAATADLFLNAKSLKLNGTRVHTPVEFALWNAGVTFIVAPMTRNIATNPTPQIIAGLAAVTTGITMVVATSHTHIRHAAQANHN